VLEGVKQVLVSKRLAEKLYSSGFHGLYGYWNIAMPCNENNRNIDFSFAQLSLEI